MNDGIVFVFSPGLFPHSPLENKNVFAACEEALVNLDAARRPKTPARLLGYLSSRVKAAATIDPRTLIAHLEKQGLIREENGKIRYLK